jgi:hypothetical protein
MTDERPVRFSVRQLLILVVFASVSLFLVTSVVRWLNAPPKGFESSEPKRGTIEIMEITKHCRSEELKDVRVWIVGGQWLLPDDFAWSAQCSQCAVDCLKSIARMQPVAKSQVPKEFWKMPLHISTMPSWWQPKTTPTTEYYMTPEFGTHSYMNGDLNLCVVYEPSDGTIYVMSQFNF